MGNIFSSFYMPLVLEVEKGVEAGKKLPRKFPSLAESLEKIIHMMSHCLITYKTELKSGPFTEK